MIRASILVSLALITLTARAEPATTSTGDAAVVKRGTIHPHLDVEGYFEPIDPLEVRVRPDAYAGDLKVVSLVPHGASVKKGDVLLEIDRDVLNRQIAAADTELANATAAVAKAKADVELGQKADQAASKAQENEVANAKAGLQWFDDVDGSQLITSAQLQTHIAKAAVDDQQDELDQLKKMYKTEELTNATADIVVKRALRNLELAKVNVSMAEQREQKATYFDYDVQRTKLVLAIDQQTSTLDQLRATQAQSLITRKTALDTAIAAQDKARKKSEDLSNDLAGFIVKAPFDGIVYYGELSAGAWQNSGPNALHINDKITANQVVMTLVALGKLHVVAEIPESRLFWIKPGDKVRIVPASDSHATTNGTCGTLIPIADNQKYAVPIDPEKIDPRLSPGDHASVQMDLPAVKDVLLAPRGAIVHGRAHVKLPDGTTAWRDVITGMSDEKNVEIQSGLEDGDALVVEEK